MFAQLHPTPARKPHSAARNATQQSRRRPFPTYLLAAAIATLITSTLFIAACGDSSDASSSDAGSASTGDLRVIDSSRLLTVDDLTSLGMKVGKEYDVATLEGATSANLLFWRVNDTAVEYEIRMYPNHADAVNLGTAPAEEGSGPDAIIDVDVANYKEGIRDRRTIFDFRAEPKPKYGAYGIYANMVILCEGRDDAEAWTRCQALIDQIAGN